MGKASNKVFWEVSCFSLHTGKNKDHVGDRQTEGRPRGTSVGRSQASMQEVSSTHCPRVYYHLGKAAVPWCPLEF